MKYLQIKRGRSLLLTFTLSSLGHIQSTFWKVLQVAKWIQKGHIWSAGRQFYMHGKKGRKSETTGKPQRNREKPWWHIGGMAEGWMLAAWVVQIFCLYLMRNKSWRLWGCMFTIHSDEERGDFRPQFHSKQLSYLNDTKYKQNVLGNCWCKFPVITKFRQISIRLEMNHLSARINKTPIIMRPFCELCRPIRDA